jgi:hypothetical protein
MRNNVIYVILVLYVFSLNIISKAYLYLRFPNFVEIFTLRIFI